MTQEPFRGVTDDCEHRSKKSMELIKPEKCMTEETIQAVEKSTSEACVVSSASYGAVNLMVVGRQKDYRYVKDNFVSFNYR